MVQKGELGGYEALWVRETTRSENSGTANALLAGHFWGAALGAFQLPISFSQRRAMAHWSTLHCIMHLLLVCYSIQMKSQQQQLVK